MRKQAERWGTELKTEDVEYVDTQNRPFTVRTSECEVPNFFYVSLPTIKSYQRAGCPYEFCCC